MPIVLNGSGPVTGVTSLNTTVSDTEIGYLDGVTSALQTQINTKADASTQGLVLIDEESFSAVSSVSLNNVFSSTYDAYRIMWKALGSSSGQDLRIRLRVGGVDATGTNYENSRAVWATSMIIQRTSLDSYNIGGVNSAGISAGSIDTYRPNASASTVFVGQSIYASTDAVREGNIVMCGHSLATSYDGFTVFPSAGNITGTFRVYGYKGA